MPITPSQIPNTPPKIPNIPYQIPNTYPKYHKHHLLIWSKRLEFYAIKKQSLLLPGQNWAESTTLCIGLCSMDMMKQCYGNKCRIFAMETRKHMSYSKVYRTPVRKDVQHNLLESWKKPHFKDMLYRYVDTWSCSNTKFCRKGVHQHRHRSHKRGDGLGDRCCRSACKLSELYAACWALFKTHCDYINTIEFACKFS